MMKKIIILLGIVALVFASCRDEETYADKKNKQNNSINDFISKRGIKVISQTDFNNQGQTTNVEKNEYVLFENTGLYMQIERDGSGEKLKNGESAELLCRYNEWNLFGDSLQSSNINEGLAYLPEKISVSNNSGVFTGTFTGGMMMALYGSSVPSAWLVPLTYIKIGRQKTASDNIALVHLIVPADQGTSTASAEVVPFAYDIYYQRN